MIGGFFGTVRDIKNGIANIIVSSVIYEVHVNEADYSIDREFHLDSGSPWWIHEYAPQDAPHELYGFRTREERDLFRRLIDIKGVGPTVAMRIVGSGITVFGPDPVCLVKIRGVGATLAQRICEAMQWA